MRPRVVLAGLLGVLTSLSCGSAEGPPPCTPPEGCLASDRNTGTCQCSAWKTVSDEVVPLKFLVTGVVTFPPGNQSGVSYGDSSLLFPPGKSQLGTRLRAVLVDAQGARHLLSAEVPSPGLGQYGLNVLGGTTLAVGMVPGDGWGLSNVVDVGPIQFDKLLVWVNPTLRLVRDAGGNLRGVWGWSGTCFWPPGAYGGQGCSAPNVFDFDLGELDGSLQSPSYKEAFLQTLATAELAFIRGYDRLASSPPPTAAELDSDPRFVRLGQIEMEPAGSLVPGTGWAPCPSTASDDDFPVFATTTVPLSASETMLIEQSWLTTTPVCSTQTPGLAIGTSTPDCRASSTLYVDRMFGTLAFLPGNAEPTCTTP